MFTQWDLSFTLLHIENAKSTSPCSLITTHEVSGLNVQRFNSNVLDCLQVFYDNDLTNLYTSYKDFNNKYINNDNIFIDKDNLVVIQDNKTIFLYSYYLDLNKQHYNLLEKIVYDIANFHFKRLNIELNQSYTIEYFLNDKFNENKILHFDHEEIEMVQRNNFIQPFLTTLTYFNESIYPTLITNVDNTFNVNDIDNILTISFPHPFKHITFEGGKYLHESGNIFNKKLKMNNSSGIKNDRFILNVLFWDKKLDYKPYFKDNPGLKSFPKDSSILTFKQNNIIETIQFDEFKPLFINMIKSPIKHNSFYYLENILKQNGFQTKQAVNTFVIKN
jgi:hypothetical protein